MDQQDESDGGSDAPPSSRAGKGIELQIPNKAIVAEEEEEVKSYVCKECNVAFSSGKALGGHRSSAHVQANKDHARKKWRKNPTLNYSGAAAANGEFSCEMCGKGFKSSKSLYGHMRCHPDRQWRGMEPPPPRVASPRPDDDVIEEPSEAEEEEEDRAVDSEASNSNVPLLNAWARKNKRGANIGPDVSAALQLINMKKISEEIVPKKISEEIVPKKISEEIVPKKIIISPAARVGPDYVPTGYLKLKETVSSTEKVSKVKQNKEKCVGEDNKTVGDDGNECQYVCGECNKRFKSYQALGGHKSSHYKRIIRIVNTEDEEMEFDLNKMPKLEEDGELRV